MTRWVRSGNSQKHKKMPGNATRWGEFDSQKANESSPKKQDRKQNSNFERDSNVACVKSSISPFNTNSESSNAKAKSKKKKSTKNKFEILCESHTKELPSALEEEFECKTPLDNFEHSENTTKHVSFEHNSNATSGKSNESLVHENSDSFSTKAKSKKQKCKKINKRDIISQIEEPTSDSKDELECETPLDEVKGLKKNKNENNKQHGLPSSSEAQKISSPKDVKTKKEIYLKKLQRKRDKMGIMLLPPKIERKLKNIRKRLQAKGYPPHLQKEILRKERRKEELLFRKTLNPSKLCFHCREAGHIFADCPKKEGNSNQETGICFKCGSSEHISFKCPEKVQGFPFAKCFICKEQGHISKDCPQNKHGVYPKGGRCNFCGNVNHLKKDCPSLRKRVVNEESSITLHTLNEATSVDAEVMETKEEENKKNKPNKRPKLVKF